MENESKIIVRDWWKECLNWWLFGVEIYHVVTFLNSIQHKTAKSQRHYYNS